MLGLVVALVALDEIVVNVSNRAELAAALSSAKPGHTILIAPGEYQGNLWASNLLGTKDRKITIAGSDKSNPPRIRAAALESSYHKSVTLKSATSALAE